MIPCTDLLALIAPQAAAGTTGRPPFPTEVMLRIHLSQQFFGHSCPAIHRANIDHTLQLSFGAAAVPRSLTEGHPGQSPSVATGESV